MASRGLPRWKLVSATALASGHPPSSTPATATHAGKLASASSITCPTRACPSDVSTACLQSMKKSLSRPEARTTRLRSNARSRRRSSRRARAPLILSAPSSSRSVPWPSSEPGPPAAEGDAAPPLRACRRPCARRARERGARGAVGVAGVCAGIDEPANERPRSDGHSRGAHVADDASAVLEHDALVGREIPLHRAADDHSPTVHTGADHAAAVERDVAAHGDLTLDVALHFEIDGAGDATAHARRATDDGKLGRLRRHGSHVHVDVALELGSVGDGHPRGLDVADDPRALLQIDALGGGDVARERPRDDELPACHVGLDGRAVLDGHAVLRGELAAERARHDDVLGGRDLAFDGDSCADDRARHEASVSLCPPSAVRYPDSAQRRTVPRPRASLRDEPPSSAGRSNSQSSRPEKRAPSSMATALPRRLPRTFAPGTSRTGPVALTSPSRVPPMVTDWASMALLVRLPPSAMVRSPRMARSPSTLPSMSRSPSPWMRPRTRAPLPM